MIVAALQHWLPYKIIYQQDQTLCKWLYVNEKRFTEPFFDETILKCLSHPYNSKSYKCVSNIEFLLPWALETKSISPTAFIFHISRCGSTLVSQLLSLLKRNIILSEVPFLDELLRLPYKGKVNIEDSDQLFAAALSLYGQKREAAERHLFVKADSWHILFYDRLRRLFPNVPFILLYRKPDEVMRSHQQRRGIHAVPGMIESEVFHFHQEEIKEINLDAYLANVLEKYYAAYLNVMHNDKESIVINYNEGYIEIMNKIVAKIGIDLSQAEWDKMKERAAFDAKYPDKEFSEQQYLPQASNSLQRCFELYQQLEEYRGSQ